jgi:hypothetical protein
METKTKFQEEQLKKIIDQDILIHTKLGEFAGGSGHMSYISYKITKIDPPAAITHNNQSCYKIHYEYTTYTETEFTFYPDNPPYEETYEKTIIIDQLGKILSD